MTTTVTTTTVTTVTSLNLVGALALIITLTLVVLLISREIVGGAQGEHEARWAQPLNTAIVPLTLCFGFIMVSKLLTSFE